MSNFTFLPTGIEGLCRIRPLFIQDDRGYFVKSFERDLFRAHGVDMEMQESFETWSYKGVLRGLHFQTRAPQAKLIRVLRGRIFDVAVDFRRGSDTFAQWEGFMLDDEDHCALYIPPGFAHGFLAVSETALVSYQCAGAYLAQEDTGVLWNDPDICVNWPLHLVDGLLLSQRDQNLPSLRACMQAQRIPIEEDAKL